MQKAAVGGILAIIASALGGLVWLSQVLLPLLLFGFIAVAVPSGAEGGSEANIFLAVYAAISIAITLLAALGIAGGIFATRRRKWSLALAGAIASSILFYPLGVIAVIFISMDYQEFSRPTASPVVNQPPGA